MKTISSLLSLAESADSASKQNPLNRRSFLGRAGAAAALLPFAGLALGATGAKADGTYTGEQTDIDILTFALNLEYLEAEYYLNAVTGAGLHENGIGTDGYGPNGAVTIKSSPKVPFDSQIIQGYAQEIAEDEASHVRFLRMGLGSLVAARPAINLLDSFNTLAAAAGIASSFDPFASETNFLLGAFIFEDVGVTAYHGALTLITNPAYLTAASGIMGTEAYHASEVRTLLLGLSQNDPSIVGTVQKISDLRNRLNAGSPLVDQGIESSNGDLNIVPGDSNSIVFTRTAAQVLNIVYGLQGASKGLFFPNGINPAPTI